MNEKKVHWRHVLVLGFIIFIGGFIFLYMVHNSSFGHFSIYVPLVTVIFGSFLMALALYKNRNDIHISEDEKLYEARPFYKYLSNPIISVSVGILIIVFIFLYQNTNMAQPGIGDSDIIVILFGLALISYSFVPEEYDVERDFILVFLFFLSIFIALIPLLFKMVGKEYTYYFLVIPLHRILNAIGIETAIFPPSTIRIIDPDSMIKGDIVIAEACSGIYSFSIFVSATISFIITIYRRIDRKSVFFIFLAILVAYIGNIIRMTIVTVSGYYFGSETMEMVHAYIGYPLFFIWMTVFWIILYRYLIERRKDREE